MIFLKAEVLVSLDVWIIQAICEYSVIETYMTEYKGQRKAKHMYHVIKLGVNKQIF